MKASDQFLQANPTWRVVIPTVPYVENLVRETTQTWSANPYIFMGDEMRRDAFAASRVALAASGTVALELGLSGIPFAIAYQVSAVTAFIIRRIMKTHYACMVNILFGSEIIPELLQEKCTVENMVNFLENAGDRTPERAKTLRKMLTS